MTKKQLIDEITEVYKKHGWSLRSVLFRPETAAELASEIDQMFEGIGHIESDVDALWFTRPSHGGAEAWELRLIAETPYALFERIKSDESEEVRNEILEGMEQRLRQYLLPKSVGH
jgi:hypothetical protein